ncbi:MAG: hypothetical protein JNL81_14515 [Hyphomonadaceae bacterium]|nr:hypothetical protein [Hyphomonadaceae bacterium]
MHISYAVAAFAAAMFTFASSVSAQTPPGLPARPGAVFVSPMGQPFRAGPESRRAPVLLWLAHADADGDERISRDEFVAEAMTFFRDTLDANHDGGATSLESTALWRAQAPEMLSARTAPIVVASSDRRPPGVADSVGARGSRIGDQGRRRGGRPPQEPPHGAGQRLPIMLGAEVEPVMSCDRDFSRRIDAAEFEACARRRFMALDVNADGYFALFESDRAREMLQANEQQAER